MIMEEFVLFRDYRISWTAEILQNFVPPLSVSKPVMAKMLP